MSDRELISIEAEHGVLGALMHNPALCEEIGAFLAPNDFSNEDHATLYTMILGCHSKKHRPDSVTLADIRSDLPSGELTIVYASEIMRNVPSAANGKQYARIVVERAKARRIYAAGLQIMELARQRGSIADQVAMAQSLVFELATQDESPDVVTYTDALSHYFEELQDRMDGKSEIGLKFGLLNLDYIIQGLRPGNLAIIAGKPGTGKTVLGTGLADSIAANGNKSSLVFSLEMQAKELSSRALASIAGVNKADLDSGDALYDELEKLKIENGISKLKQFDVRVCDKPGITFARLCSIARFEHRARKLDLIVVDYLTLIASDPSSKFQTRSAEIGSFTRGLKMLAKELGLPIVVLAQLNRAMDNRSGDARPKMSDLRDSGEIEQDADVIIMGYRDEKSALGQQGVTEWDVVKCRHSKPGRCVLQFEGQYQRFKTSSLSWDEYEAKINQRKEDDAPNSGLSSFKRAK